MAGNGDNIIVDESLLRVLEKSAAREVKDVNSVSGGIERNHRISRGSRNSC